MKKKDTSKPMKDMLGNRRTEAEYCSAAPSWKTVPLARGYARYKRVGELGWVWLAASKDETRPTLMHAWGDGNHLAATDGFRLHVVPSDLHGFYTVTKNLAVPDNFEGTFPDCNRIIPKKCARWVTLPAGALWRALAVAWVFVKKQDYHRVLFTLRGVSLTIHAVGAETGDCDCPLNDGDEVDGRRIRVRVSNNASEFKIAVNAKYLLDAVSAFPAEAEVKLAFNSNSQPVVVTGAGSEAKAVIMPLDLGVR